jgi:hypothetical protein
MLDSCKVPVQEMGETAMVYFSQRLLSRQVMTWPRLHSICIVASRLAREDDEDDTTNSERYTAYINTLSKLLSRQSTYFMRTFFIAAHPVYTAELDIDIMTAAAYTGHLSIVQELSKSEASTEIRWGTFGQVYAAAALGGNPAIIDHMLQMADLHKRDVASVCTSMLSAASKAGALGTVQHLLASPWMPDMWFPPTKIPKGRVKGKPQLVISSPMETPNVEVFRALRQYKDALASPQNKTTKHELTDVIQGCASSGYTDLVAYLIGLKVPVDNRTYIYTDWESPLLMATKGNGSAPLVRLLLENGADTRGRDTFIRNAAKKGRFAVVKLLAEYGADLNGGDPLPLVNAIRLEHEDMFHYLLEHGAGRATRTYDVAMSYAMEGGLESMIELLKEWDAKRRGESDAITDKSNDVG